MPLKMRAIEIAVPGGPDVLRLTTRNVPEPDYGQILIKIAYAGVNRPDVLQRSGVYNPPPGASDLPGLEAAGTVAALGPGVTKWALGDAVCALLPGGGYADYALTHQDHALPLPIGMDMAKAAALCETFFTVWGNVFRRGGLTGGERFLVHGGTSGIGTTAIQLAHHFGARVFATAGTDEKCAVCEKLGAERAINYQSEDFVDVLCADGGANLILDMVGGPYVRRNIRALADDGRLVQIAFLQGAKVDLDLTQIMTRRLTITGSTLRPQSNAAKAAIAADLAKIIWPLLGGGRITPVMDQIFPLEHAAAAHTRMESGQHIGKIVLTMSS